MTTIPRPTHDYLVLDEIHHRPLLRSQNDRRRRLRTMAEHVHQELRDYCEPGFRPFWRHVVDCVAAAATPPAVGRTPKITCRVARTMRRALAAARRASVRPC